MKAVLARIPELRGRLDAAASELNKTLLKVEAALLGLRLGVYVGVPLPLDDERRPRFLSFLRDGKVWMLTVERPAVELKGRTLLADSEPLIAATLATRKMAVDHLPALLDAMLKKAKAESEKVETKTDALHAFIKNTQKLTGPKAQAARIERAADELIARLQEQGLDIEFDSDRVFVVDVLSKYFFRP
jgi:hypothetical protein